MYMNIYVFLQNMNMVVGCKFFMQISLEKLILILRWPIQNPPRELQNSHQVEYYLILYLCEQYVACNHCVSKRGPLLPQERFYSKCPNLVYNSSHEEFHPSYHLAYTHTKEDLIPDDSRNHTASQYYDA